MTCFYLWQIPLQFKEYRRTVGQAGPVGLYRSKVPQWVANIIKGDEEKRHSWENTEDY